jgi:hypothetical protein
MATQIQIENNIHLERLMSTNPEMEKEIQKILRKVIREAAKQVSLSASAVIANDPRKAANAVRSTVYKSILGASVHLYSSGKAGKGQPYFPVRRLRDGQRGGNRIPRSEKTERMMSYVGSERSFILRWLSSGTATRSSRYGNRGAIAARNWFAPATDRAMNAAIDHFNTMVEELITQELAAK